MKRKQKHYSSEQQILDRIDGRRETVNLKRHVLIPRGAGSIPALSAKRQHPLKGSLPFLALKNN